MPLGHALRKIGEYHARESRQNAGCRSKAKSPRSREMDANSMHFHACWKIEFDVPTRPMHRLELSERRPARAFSPAWRSSSTIPSKAWWGEGDEKIYVDGEKFPSHFGTGTEDYYGYAWCSPEKFYARLSQPAALRRPGQLRPHERESLPYPRPHPVRRRASSSTWNFGTGPIAR